VKLVLFTVMGNRLVCQTKLLRDECDDIQDTGELKKVPVARLAHRQQSLLALHLARHAVDGAHQLVEEARPGRSL